MIRRLALPAVGEPSAKSSSSRTCPSASRRSCRRRRPRGGRPLSASQRPARQGSPPALRPARWRTRSTRRIPRCQRPRRRPTARQCRHQEPRARTEPAPATLLTLIRSLASAPQGHRRPRLPHDVSVRGPEIGSAQTFLMITQKHPSKKMADNGLEHALKAIDPVARAMLDLSIRRRLPDSSIADLAQMPPDELVRWRGELLDQIASQIGLTGPNARDQVRAQLERSTVRLGRVRAGRRNPEAKAKPKPRKEPEKPKEKRERERPSRPLLGLLALLVVLVIVVAAISLVGSDDSADSTPPPTTTDVDRRPSPRPRRPSPPLRLNPQRPRPRRLNRRLRARRARAAARDAGSGNGDRARERLRRSARDRGPAQGDARSPRASTSSGSTPR